MYRLRVGNWRVIFTESLELVTIEEGCGKALKTRDPSNF